MMTPHPAASWPPIRTGVCRAGRSVPSRYEKLTGPGLPSSNQPDRERTTAYRDSSGPISRSDAYCATIVGDWQEPSGECRINSIAPGYVETDLGPASDGLKSEDVAAATVIGRIATPRDIAHIALFLASDLSRHIVGETIVADGGGNR